MNSEYFEGVDKYKRLKRWETIDLGKHIQAGELQEVDKETMRITVYFDEYGKVSLRNLIAKGAGQKLILSAEGVTVGEGEVPHESDGSLLTFTLMPDKLKRLEHAFEMSNLKLIRAITHEELKKKE